LGKNVLVTNPTLHADPLPQLRDFEHSLGLPAGLASRDLAERSSAVTEVLDLKLKQPRRTYLLGVLLAYIAMAEKISELTQNEATEDVFRLFPAKATDQKGGLSNTLTLVVKGELLSLRTQYNLVEHVVRHDLNRPHYPNAAPHATQSWAQHQREFELIVGMTAAERALLAHALWDQVTSIPASISDVNGARETRPFELLLETFSSSVRGEPGGAVLQGLAYAYYRADSPSVTLRVFKVGSGSTRVNATGDVDGWVGGQLALSVEVKDLDIRVEHLSQFDQFRKQLVRWPNATAVALARSFDLESTAWLASRNILTLNRARMADNVAFWDLPKQQMAVREFMYFLNVIQANANMIARFSQYCEENGIEI
jgi:hypothetical protein